jgi:two-component system sensor histidine kinase KdpD
LARTRPYLLAAGAAAAATLMCSQLDEHMSVAGLSMVYLVAVIAAAMTLTRGAGVFASLLCVSALNFFFVPPRYTFEVDSAEYLWTLAVLLAVSLVLNGLIASLRTRHSRAETAQLRASQLHGLGESLAQERDVAAMATSAAKWFQRELRHSTAVFLKDSPAAFTSGPDAIQFQGSAAQWAMDNARPLGRGCVDWPDLPLWCAPFGSGAVQLLLGPYERPAEEEQRHWLALVRQVGLAIDRERASRDARAAQEEARAEAARNTLLASLSHDLRTPLAGILGTATTLRSQSDALSPSQREQLLANLENETRDLAAMADNVLQLARLSQPHVELRKQWESLEEVLAAAVARMRKRWPAARIQLHASEALPPIHAEAALLAQAVGNLVDNAVRHSGNEPRIDITAGRSRTGVFLAVRDHGSGMAGAKPGAAGLGLSICKLVVEAHAGQMASRHCDPGTEFRIDLPT